MHSLNQNEEKNLKLLKNLKQIGGIEEKIRIYVEDYVHTYLQNYARANGSSEKIAVLVGRYSEEGGRLFISGAIQGKFSKTEKGIEIFTDETWDYIETQMDIYFDKMEIVGWVHAQPGYGNFLIPRNEAYHKENFTKKHHLLYVLDIIEKTDCFYKYDDNYRLTEAAGYFIYYDRNEKMHEYMLDNNFAGIKTDSEEEFDLQKAFDSLPEVDKDVEVVSVSRRKIRDRKAKIYNHNRVINMMATISGVLFLICFLMGAGLIQNGDRISKLETDLSDLNQTYKDVAAQIKNHNVTPVFAGTDLPEVNETPEASQAKVIVENDNPPHPSYDSAEEAPETVPNDVADSSLEEVEPAEEPKVDLPEPEASAVQIPESYMVEPGDSLIFISMKFYGSKDKVGEIMSLNNLGDPNKLVAGKKIMLPKP